MTDRLTIHGDQEPYCVICEEQSSCQSNGGRTFSTCRILQIYARLKSFEDLADIAEEKLSPEVVRVLVNPKEFSGWLDRMLFHVRKVSELRQQLNESTSQNFDVEHNAESLHMCEWKYAEAYETSPCVTSCGKIHWRQDEIAEFNYCPYCGKKIREARRNEQKYHESTAGKGIPEV